MPLTAGEMGYGPGCVLQDERGKASQRARAGKDFDKGEKLLRSFERGPFSAIVQHLWWLLFVF